MSAGDPGDDERQVVRAAAAGDAEAFARLYQRHVQAVVRRLSHLVGPSGSVEDLAQETFLRAMRAMHGFRGESPYRHWLLRIAHSVARDEQRRTRRSLWRLFTEPEQIDETPAESGNPERYADLVMVHRALRRLSPRLREVVVLFELEGESLPDIAAQLDISLNTAGSRLRRGREKLRRALEQSGYAPRAVPASILA